MAVVNVDWDSMEENSFELLEIGEYPAKIEKVALKGPGPSGYKYLEFTIALTEHKGRKVWSNYSFAPNALWKMQEELLDFGVSGVAEGEFDYDEFVGLDCIATLGIQDKYKAKPDVNGDMPQENTCESIAPGGF